MNLTITSKVVKSFFTRADKKYPRGCIPIKLRRQWTPFSCTAAVAQMVAHHHGFRLSHLKAIHLTQCYPDGASLSHVARVLRKEYGMSPKRLNSRREIHAALKRGDPIITNDAITYEHDHAVLLVGKTAKGVWMADPALGGLRWMHQDVLRMAADEFIVMRV